MASVIIAGDLCPIDRVAKLFEARRFEEVLSELKPIFEGVDYTVVNLEAPIVKGSGTPIRKVGPNLKCSQKVIDAIQYAGIKGVTLANNHFFDYGEDGALNTIQKLDESKIDYVGAGKNDNDAAKPIFVKVGTKNVAIINCCEHEYSIATRDHAGSNALNPVSLYYAIKEAKEKADYVLVIVHGGIEHYQLPTPRMKETYHFAIDCGADAVVNHHQHCYSGYEVYNDKPIFYGLGNFCFDRKGKRNDKWNEGYMVKINIEDNSFELLPYRQCYENPSVLMMQGNERGGFFSEIEKLNQIIADPAELERKLKEFAVKSKRGFSPFNPYTNPYLNGLYRRGWLPSFVSKKKLMSIQNKIECESHLERLKLVVQEELKS